MSKARLVAYKLFANQWNPFGEEIVTLEHFGRITGFFPPMVEFGDGIWVSKIMELTKNTWFWGDSSRYEVEAVFAGPEIKIGTFVVRFANNSSFRLSIKTGQGEVAHYKIRHAYQGTTCSVKNCPELEGKSFSTLKEMADEVAKVLNVELCDPAYSAMHIHH